MSALPPQYGWRAGAQESLGVTWAQDTVMNTPNMVIREERKEPSPYEVTPCFFGGLLR